MEIESITIKASTFIDDCDCADADDGQRLFDVATKALDEGVHVEVSLEGVEVFTTSFFNESIGQLYRRFSESFIEEHLSFIGMRPSTKVAMKYAIATVKMCIEDSEGLRECIDRLNKE